MDEACRLRQDEGYEVCIDAKAGETTGAFLRQSSHFCPQCGQFRELKMALFYVQQNRIGAVFTKNPELCRVCRHNFGAYLISGG